MDQSITLLKKTLEKTSTGELADAIGVKSSSLSNCKKIGQLSPLLAGQIAVFLNENVEHWIAVAATENLRPCKAKEQLLAHLRRPVKSCF